MSGSPIPAPGPPAAGADRWPALRPAIDLCDRRIAPIFVDADQKAIESLHWRRRVTIAAAIAGTMAVLLAIVQLLAPKPPRELAILEFALLTTLVIVVFVGVRASYQVRWLRFRHRAEQCRGLPFRLLMDPALWSQAGTIDEAALRGPWKERLEREMAEIERDEPSSGEHWALTRVPRDPLPIRLDTMPMTDDLRQLVDYYRTARLDNQIDFFSRRASEHGEAARGLHVWGPLLFIGGVVAAYLHFGAELVAGFVHHAPRVHEAFEVAGRVFIVLAAALPVVAAGVRTYRLAHESSRLHLRYESIRNALRGLSDKLRVAGSPRAVFHDLHEAEDLLEGERREWLLLMMETEWFG